METFEGLPLEGAQLERSKRVCRPRRGWGNVCALGSHANAFAAVAAIPTPFLLLLPADVAMISDCFIACFGCYDSGLCGMQLRPGISTRQ
jgi:hypothetical protein